MERIKTGARRRMMFALLRFTGIPFLLRHTVQRRRITVLFFHKPDRPRFERFAQLLSKMYSLITLDEFLAVHESGDWANLPPRPLLVTFDDGRASNYDLLPIFKRLNMRPAIFLCTAIVGTNRHFWWSHLDAAEAERLKRVPDAERIATLREMGRPPECEYDTPEALSVQQLREMQPHVDFQPHTRWHPILTMCSPGRVREELAGSQEDLRSLLGIEGRAFAYPNGDHTAETEQLVAEAGFTCAFTIEPGLNTRRSAPFRRQRIFIPDDADVHELVVCTSGFHGTLRSLFG